MTSLGPATNSFGQRHDAAAQTQPNRAKCCPIAACFLLERRRDCRPQNWHLGLVCAIEDAYGHAGACQIGDLRRPSSIVMEAPRDHLCETRALRDARQAVGVDVAPTRGRRSPRVACGWSRMPSSARNGSISHMSAKNTPAAARVGDLLEARGIHGEPARRGQIVEILGEPRHEHYKVHWDEQHESIVYPADGVEIIRKRSR